MCSSISINRTIYFRLTSHNTITIDITTDCNFKSSSKYNFVENNAFNDEFSKM